MEMSKLLNHIGTKIIGGAAVIIALSAFGINALDYTPVVEKDMVSHVEVMYSVVAAGDATVEARVTEIAKAFNSDICQRYEYAKAQMEVALEMMIARGESPSVEFLNQLAFYRTYISANC